MSFSYRPIEEVVIEQMGNVQSLSNQDETFCPSRPLLPKWPFWIGLCQICMGFLCAIFGAIELFLVPFFINIDSEWHLDRSNSYGAALWSGTMLILAGSTAVRAAKFQQLLHVLQFYIVTVFAFLSNFSLMIVILWSFQHHSLSTEAAKYSTVSLLSAVWCLLGCLLLTITVTKYFMPVLCEEVKLLKRLGVCLLPCFFSNVPSASSSRQSVNSTESNLIV